DGSVDSPPGSRGIQAWCKRQRVVGCPWTQDRTTASPPSLPPEIIPTHHGRWDEWHLVRELSAIRRWDEWHLDFGKSFRHLAFEFCAWLCQPVVMIASLLLRAWFVTIRSVGDSMRGDGIQEVLIHPRALCRVACSAKLNQRLEGFQSLNGTLKAD